MFRIATVTALVLSILSAGAVAAADAGGSTSESLTVASTISFVTPTSQTYIDAGTGNEYRIDPSQTVSTNNATGWTLKVRASALTGPVTIPTTDRTVDPGSAPAGVTFTSIPYGGFANASTDYTIATKASAGSSALSWTFKVQNVSVAGTYSGSLDFVATTNP
jgi:hypothetical protein